MQLHYAAHFVRDMGCTETEWRQWLRAALPDHEVPLASHETRIDIASTEEGQAPEQGSLHLRWSVLPARQIALIRIPRLQVAFEFDGLSDAARNRFMRRLDLFLQRGGG